MRGIYTTHLDHHPKRTLFAHPHEQKSCDEIKALHVAYAGRVPGKRHLSGESDTHGVTLREPVPAH